ncbi:unnamed protein product, partial [Penicillium salamii]
FVTRLSLSEVARCTQRGLFEAIAGECEELETTSYQHAMNGDCIDGDNSPLIFPSLESNAKRAILSAQAPLYRCDRKLSVPSSLPRWDGRGMNGMFTSSRPFSQSPLCTSHVLMCLPDTKLRP